MTRELYTIDEIRDWLHQQDLNTKHSSLNYGIEYLCTNLTDFEDFVDDERQKRDIGTFPSYSDIYLEQVLNNLYWIGQSQTWEERKQAVNDAIRILSFIKEVTKDDSKDI